MRNRYEEAYGVTRLDWRMGEPPEDEAGPFIVEVWRSDLQLNWQADRPRVRVHAEIEIRLKDGGDWKYLRWNGLFPVRDGEIRRWAPLAHRHWYGNLKLEGWNG